MVAPYSGAILPMVARSATRQACGSLPKKLNELAHDLFFAEHFGDAQGQICRSHPLLRASC